MMHIIAIVIRNYYLYQISMNVIRIMVGANRFALTLMEAMNALVLMAIG